MQQINTLRLRDQRSALQLAALASVLVLAAGALLYGRSYLRAGQYWVADTDYQVFYAAAIAIRHHADPFLPTIAWIQQYNPHHHLGVLFATKSYAYPPLFAVLQIPFSFLSLQGAIIAWDLCNVVFLAVALYALLRIVNITPNLLGLFVLMTAALLTDPIRKELFLAQADIFLLCLVCVAFWARLQSRSLIAGILLGVACAIKPQLLLWLVLLLWKREFSFAITTIVTFLVLFFAPFLWLGGHVWHDQWTVFGFWSNQYLAYDHNDSPRGILVRLLTVNPVVRPLVVAPLLATLLWLFVVLGVGILALSRIAPQPLRQDARSALEIGLWVPAMLLVGPLSEWPYWMYVAIPLLGVAAYYRDSVVQHRGLIIGVLAVWLALCGPLTRVENFFVTRFAGHSVLTDLYVILAPAYFYALLAVFALQLHALGADTERPLVADVRQFALGLPNHVLAWFHDARASLVALPRN